MSDPSLSPSAQQVREHDRDRYVTALFAPAERREALFAVYAFHLEIARVRERVREPMMGLIRLQWWRDVLDALYRGQPMAAPAMEPLADAIRRFTLPQESFDALIAAREAEFHVSAPPPDLMALESDVAVRAAQVTDLALSVLGATDPASRAAGRHVGLAWGLTGTLRAIEFDAAQGRVLLPQDLLRQAGLSAEAILGTRHVSGLRSVAEPIADRARTHLAAARALRKEVARAAIPALLQATQAERHLDALARRNHEPLADRRWAMPHPRPLQLGWRAFWRRW